MQKLDFSSLEKALQSMQDSLDVVANVDWFEQQEVAVRNTLISGVIQNFEFVYELCIKMLRRQLELEADSREIVDHASYRDMLRMAAEKGLIGNVEAWFEYRHLRNITSHTYNLAKAETVYQHCQVFINDAVLVLKSLKAR